MDNPEAEDVLVALLRSRWSKKEEEDKSAEGLKFRRSHDGQKDRMHSAMRKGAEPVVVLPEEYKDEDLAIVSEADELQEEELQRSKMGRDDALLALFECQDPPVASLREVGTFLEHPDHDQFNSWIETGA